MNFQEFWKLLQVELSQKKELKTVTRYKKFQAYFDHNEKGDLFVLVITELGKSRRIPVNEFKGLWDTMKKYSRETRFVNKDRRLNTYQSQDGVIGNNSFNVSYIIALINYILIDQDME